jgi:dihydroneopterin aldolase
MPIEVKELIVKATIGGKEEEKDLNQVYQTKDHANSSQALTPAMKRELIESCVEEVIKKLNAQKAY